MAADSQDYDEQDVAEALKRETQDGPGFEDEDELPESDFDGFPEDDVENDHDEDHVVSDEEDESK